MEPFSKLSQKRVKAKLHLKARNFSQDSLSKRLKTCKQLRTWNLSQTSLKSVSKQNYISKRVTLLKVLSRKKRVNNPERVLSQSLKYVLSKLSQKRLKAKLTLEAKLTLKACQGSLETSKNV